MSERIEQASATATSGTASHFIERVHDTLSWENARRQARPLALFMATSALAGMYLSRHESAETNIASHDSVVTFAHDGYATFDVGPHEPSFRIKSGAPFNLGNHVDVGTTDAKSMNQLISRYAAIAAQPSGEIANLKDTTVSLGVDIAVKSGLAGLAGAAMWPLVGARRRKELWEKTREQSRARKVAALGVTALLVNGCAVSDIAITQPGQTADQWASLAGFYPDLKLDPELGRIEVEKNFLTTKELDLIRGAIMGYEKSKIKYGDIEARARQIGPLLRQPQQGDKVALFVADRHDNIGMDPVNRAIGVAGEATIFLDGGDDTSDDQSWEKFSINSVNETTKHVKYRVSASGNHDHGGLASKELKDAGFTVMDGKTKDIDGIRMIGLPDPKASGMVNSASFASTSLSGQAKELADITCAADKKGKRISTILVHEEGAGAEALKEGCVDIVLSGHEHQFKGPETVIGENGSKGTNFVDSTAGGATIAMALGPLRRDAGEALVTYHNGVPIGIQKVTVTQGGLVLPSAFEPLPRYYEYFTSSDVALTRAIRDLELRKAASNK